MFSFAILFAVLAASLTAAAPTQAQDQLHYYPGSLTKSEASDYCEKHGQRLAAINQTNILKAAALLKDDAVWIDSWNGEAGPLVQQESSILAAKSEEELLSVLCEGEVSAAAEAEAGNLIEARGNRKPHCPSEDRCRGRFVVITSVQTETATVTSVATSVTFSVSVVNESVIVTELQSSTITFVATTVTLRTSTVTASPVPASCGSQYFRVVYVDSTFADAEEVCAQLQFSCTGKWILASVSDLTNAEIIPGTGTPGTEVSAQLTTDLTACLSQPGHLRVWVSPSCNSSKNQLYWNSATPQVLEATTPLYCGNESKAFVLCKRCFSCI